jgi:hypothetical protein
MKQKSYASPAAFKAAVDQRLRDISEPGVGITRRRQLLVFDRYLARLARVLGEAAVLKGGLALELRLERARTTRDIDLRLTGTSGDLLERLQEAGRLDLGDFMSFEVRPDSRHPEIAGDGVRYEGQRFRAEHVAEKVHAYTLPRATGNTRAKDLPDLALLGQAGPRTAREIRSALRQTFEFRGTHPVPPGCQIRRPPGRIPTRPWRTRTRCPG